MANEVLGAWFTSLTLNHKNRQRTKQEVFHQTELEVFLQVLIFHGLNSSRKLWIRGHHLALSCWCCDVFLNTVTRLYFSLLVNMCPHVYILRAEFWMFGCPGKRARCLLLMQNRISHELQAEIDNGQFTKLKLSANSLPVQPAETVCQFELKFSSRNNCIQSVKCPYQLCRNTF